MDREVPIVLEFFRECLIGVCVHLSMDDVMTVTRAYCEGNYDEYIHILWTVSTVDGCYSAHVDVLLQSDIDYYLDFVMFVEIEGLKVDVSLFKDKCLNRCDYWAILYDYIHENGLKKYCVNMRKKRDY